MRSFNSITCCNTPKGIFHDGPLPTYLLCFLLRVQFILCNDVVITKGANNILCYQFCLVLHPF